MERQKKSTIDRVVVDTAFETRNIKRRREYRNYEKQFAERDVAYLKERERLPTPEEKRVILLCDKLASEIVDRLGGNPISLPFKNVHVIPKDKWPEGEENSPGMYRQIWQGIAIQEQDDLAQFAEFLLHEMIHAKLYNAVALLRQKNPHASYRNGLVAVSQKRGAVYFSTLNEAVIHELVVQNLHHVLQDPIFGNSYEETERIKRNAYEYRGKDGTKLLPEEMYQISSTNDASRQKYSLHGQRWISNNTTKGSMLAFALKEARVLLYSLVDKLRDAEGDQFSRQETFEIFARAAATGNLLPIRRRLDSAFGVGTFRRLADHDSRKIVENTNTLVGTSTPGLEKFIEELEPVKK